MAFCRKFTLKIGADKYDNSVTLLDYLYIFITLLFIPEKGDGRADRHICLVIFVYK